MAEMNDTFNAIFSLAKDGRDIRDEGLPPEEFAAHLLMAESVLDQIAEKVKAGKKSIKDYRELIGETLNEARRNPNATLDQFAEPEMPRSTGLDNFATEEPHQPEQDSAEEATT